MFKVSRKAPGIWTVALEYHSTKRNQSSLEKWLMPGLGQEMYVCEMSLEHLVLSDARNLSNATRLVSGLRTRLKTLSLAKIGHSEFSVKITAVGQKVFKSVIA